MFRRTFFLLLVLAPLSALASTDWQQPTPEEMKMTSYAAAPGAPAIYLFREETVDDNVGVHCLYARVKILTEKGKEMFGDIEIPYVASGFSINNVDGRTIHSDGTVIPFTGTPYDKLLVKEGHESIMAKVFSMPDVQVGSILEFRYKIKNDTGWVWAPNWHMQQLVPVLKAHYNFRPNASAGRLQYTLHLPPEDKILSEKNGSYDLTIENIPALPDEDYLPPFGNNRYHLVFYYTGYKTSDEYWKAEGAYWSKDFDRFARVSDKIRDAVNGILAPGDADDQKVEKIYAAVMKLENTSFTREHSAAENKAEHLKVKTAQDIWAQQRGYDDEITRLFVALVRAAGLKAYGAAVVNRDESIFDPNYLSWSQLDDELAIVEIDGKEVYFDPGQRYCEFGKLHWKHTWAGGVRQTANGTQVFTTPGPEYQENSLNRTAQLTLDPDGRVHGLIQEMMDGVEALTWRQAALRGDEDEVKKQFEEQLQSSMPPGVQVKLNHFVGLTDFTHPLMVVVNVSGTLGTQTGKHIFLPAVFFEAGNAPMFAQTHRENPVDLHYPYTIRDQFKLTLPSNITIDSLPTGGEMPFAPNADYIAKFVSQPNAFAYGRLLIVAKVLYKADEYPSLHSFFQKVSADDQEQVALKVAPAADALSGGK
jgi:Domain of Unknown Function with PDB structure (DUF3857)